MSGVAPTSTLNSSINRGCATPVVSDGPPLPSRNTATLAGWNEGEGVVETVDSGVMVGVPVVAGVPVGAGERVEDGEGVGVTVSAVVGVGDCVSAGDDVGTADCEGVMLGVELEEPVMDAESPNEIEGVPVEAGVLEAAALPVADEDGVTEGVLDCVGVCDDEAVEDGVLEHDGHTGGEENGAAVTPRNTVFVGATASTSTALVAVLYAYSLVGDVAYSINTPHTPSCRPAREMMAVPDSSSMAEVGVCRAHTPPVEVNSAMLLVVSAAVSVVHRVVAEANTNPYGDVVAGMVSTPLG